LKKEVTAMIVGIIELEKNYKTDLNPTKFSPKKKKRGKDSVMKMDHQRPQGQQFRRRMTPNR
jgi:hypothetical protein